MSFAPNQSGAVYGVTSGIARDMQAAPSPLAGGDMNGTAATTIIFSHAGTSASFLGLPRLGNPNMGIASPVAVVDFAVDDRPRALIEDLPEPIGDMIASGELDEIMSATEGEPPSDDPEPEPPEHHSRHHGKRRR